MMPYKVKAQFRAVKDLSGNTSTIPANHVIAIGAMPLLVGMD